MRPGGQPPDEERSFAEIRKILQDILRILALHPWAFFVPFCVATSAAFVVSLYSPRTYSASTTFQRRDDPVALSLDISSGAASFKYFRKSMVSDLRSVRYMAEVVENLGLTKEFERDANDQLTRAAIRRRDSIARSLASRLNISSRSLSDFVDEVTINYTGSDPHIGRKLVEEAKNTYIRRSREWIRDHLIAQRDYFQKQFENAGAELAEARREATRFRLDHPLVDPSDPAAVSVRLSQLENQRKTLQLRKSEYEADLIAQRQLLRSLDPMASLTEVGPPSERQTTSPITAEALKIADEIRKTDRAIAELRTTRGMTLRHPEVVEMAAKKERLEASFEHQLKWDVEHRQPSDGVTTPSESALIGRVAILPVQIDQARAASKVATFEIKLRDVTERIEENEGLAEALLLAKKDIFVNQEEFAQVRDRVNNARLEHTKLQGTLSKIKPAIEATNQDRLVQFVAGPPAQGSVLPIAPKAKNIVFLALVIGAAAGVLFVILAEILDHVYRSAGQVARSLGIPILDSIDEIVTGQDRRRILVQRLVVTPMVLGGGLVLTSLSGAMAYLSLGRPDAYAKLRQIPQAAMEFFAVEAGRPIDPGLARLRDEDGMTLNAEPSVGPTEFERTPDVLEQDGPPEMEPRDPVGAPANTVITVANARMSLHEPPTDGWPVSAVRNDPRTDSPEPQP